MVQADLDVVQLDLNALQQDIASGAPATQIRQDLRDLKTALVDLAHAEARLAADTRADLGGAGHHHDAADLDDLDDLSAHLGRRHDGQLTIPGIGDRPPPCFSSPRLRETVKGLQ